MDVNRYCLSLDSTAGTSLRGGSIILGVKMRDRPAPQRGGSPHSGEGKNGRVHLIKTERRGYKKIPLRSFKISIRRTCKHGFDQIG
jgi:hypothetical protein